MQVRVRSMSVTTTASAHVQDVTDDNAVVLLVFFSSTLDRTGGAHPVVNVRRF